MSPSTLDALSAYALPPLPALNLPPLPPIADPEYYDTVTSHASLRKGAHSNHELNPKVALKDYEKLEHVGDALLGAVVAVILHDLFPMIGEGPASMLKGQLVSNAILAQLSGRYGLPSLLRTDPGAQYIVRKQVKAQASVFEAWVAGVYYTVLDSMSDGEEEEEGEGGDGVEDESDSDFDCDCESVAEKSGMTGGKGDDACSVVIGGNKDKEGMMEKEARSVRFSEDVIVEELEPASPGPPEHSGQGHDQNADTSVGYDENTSSAPGTPVSPDQLDTEDADSSEPIDVAADSATTDAVASPSDDPFAQLLHIPAKPTSPALTSPPTNANAETSPIGDAQATPIDDNATPSAQISTNAPSPTPSPPPPHTAIPTPAHTPTNQNAIRLRWLAMCVLDDWLRPIFTPLAMWAMDCLRAEQVRIRAARTKAYMDVDALDAKTKGCMTVINHLVQRGEVDVPVYEVQRVEEGWQVVCRVVKKSGEVLTAQSIRTAKKPAQNIATYRILVQLGEVDDADEFARSVLESSSTSSCASMSDAGEGEDLAACEPESK